MGNKRRLAEKIRAHFPKEESYQIYVEPFFGAGGMFFNKPKSKYNFLNDNDSEVFNLFNVVTKQREELEKAWKMVPRAFDLLNHWKKDTPGEPVMRACRFLFMSNYTFLCKGGTMMWKPSNAHQTVLDRIEKTQELLFGCQFTNYDFKDFFKKVKLEGRRTFIYADPPYLDTSNNYQSGFKKDDTAALIDELQATGANWAMSEFNHPFILQLAEKNGLRVIEIGERHNIATKSVEILLVNY